ncbi:amidase [Robiginitalea aurantiaca]|uniref:Amidase n=1 Tax=Robiginitalea aurantiaca TaxID=3056915 RepID=A0ABT7WIT1_9FLAO|nr:amidase [Robiginitalea aurantiaca]MDM9632825.1 amidase [Robiginitalea aurantiaca]
MERRDFVKKSGSSVFYTAIAGSVLPGVFSSCENGKKETPQIIPELFDEFMQYDAIGLSELIKTKQISPAELLEVVIKRIEYFNPKINAVNIKLYERAREMVLNTNSNSVFAGVPVLIKDMIDIGGVVRSDGSKLMQNNIPSESVSYIVELEKSGLTIVGRTNVPEFASHSNTWNELFGKTLNPWDVTKTVFGSSGGSSAAVAAGIVPLAHGTDGAGSNRIPPNACGLFGFKPSRGRLASGEKGGADDFLKTNCGISRSVRDNEQLFIATQKRENNPYVTIKNSLKNIPLKSLKVGYIRTGLEGYEIDPEIVAKQDEIVKLLTSLGHQVKEVTIPLNGDDFYDQFNVFFLTKFVPLVNNIMANNSAYTEIGDIKELTNFVKTEAIFAKDFNEEELAKATDYITNTIPAIFESMFEENDVLFSAVCPIKTQPIEFLNPMTDSFMDKKFIVGQTLSLTCFANICGHPAMSVPLSTIDNLPLGSMFQASIGNDESLYQLAYQLEEAKPWKDQWPEMSYK